MGSHPAGARLRRLRAARGLSQEQLAHLLGVSFATVNRWETGRTQMSARARRALADFEARDGSAAPAAEPAVAPSPPAHTAVAPSPPAHTAVAPSPPTDRAVSPSPPA